MPNLEQIKSFLADHQPVTIEKASKQAAVALILSGVENDLEMLMLRRAEHQDDPWSGDLGFPGGKIDPDDHSARAAAERETIEETGIRLNETDYLGRLDDISGAYLPVSIACFVFYLPTRPQIVLNREVSHYWWVPLHRFLEPDRHRDVAFTYRQQHRTHPVIDLVDPEHPFLWGITYRLTESFFRLIERPLPVENRSE
ncbi:MAG: CoA pyrophosphatase [Desulfuromonas sp.]|nr:MAG: CoA pyrophosphatase [Desulfuromonas sp.]